MKKQVFLGGTCGTTTWRNDIAIPALENAGVTYYNPQLGLGEWTEACEAAEMKAKAEADVLLFVISGSTRGVASIAEVAYLIAAGRPLALALEFMAPGLELDGKTVAQAECDDLNRGRIFVRTMAAEHGVPVFSSIDEAVQHTIYLAQLQAQTLLLDEIQSVLAEVSFKGFEFGVERVSGGFHLQLQAREPDLATGDLSPMQGRKWFVSETAQKSDIVRTAFKAVLTWQEHEAREFFKYQDRPIFGPHFNVDDLVAFSQQNHHAD